MKTERDNIMKTKRSWMTILSVTALFVFYAQTSSPSPEAQSCPLQKPASSMTAQAEGQTQPAPLSVPELVALGEKSYWRSCESCHGLKPEGLPYVDAQHFGKTVAEGNGDMPALGFKLDMQEIEAIRLYVAYCSYNELMC